MYGKSNADENLGNVSTTAKSQCWLVKGHLLLHAKLAHGVEWGYWYGQFYCLRLCTRLLCPMKYVLMQCQVQYDGWGFSWPQKSMSKFRTWSGALRTRMLVPFEQRQQIYENWENMGARNSFPVCANHVLKVWLMVNCYDSPVLINQLVGGDNGDTMNPSLPQKV